MSVRQRAYSLLEVLITILIIHIISGMVMVNVSTIQTSEKLSRAGEQVVTALRYARTLSMTTGEPAGVEFNMTTNQIRVFQGVSATTVTNNLISGGQYVIDLPTQSEIAGVKITTASLVGNTTNPYWVVFGRLGGTTNNGSVTLTYGQQSKRVVIPLVGEAKVQ
jgi:Tfp pilus assembly protein FimT